MASNYFENTGFLFSGNYLTALTFCAGPSQLMASLCCSQTVFFYVFFFYDNQCVMCLYPTLLLPSIKGFLLIKISLRQKICRRRVFPLSCQWSRQAVSDSRETFDHPAGVSSVGSAACERGTVTQLWQPSGTSDGWHARMGHAGFPGACIDRRSSCISNSASAGLIVGHAGHRCDTWRSVR